jgi:uncharacterized protein DUF4349
MTVNEIVGELRGTRPRASDALRLQVMTLAARPAPRTPTLGERLRARRGLAMLVPVGAALAVAAAVVVGVTRSGSTGPVQSAAPETARSAGTGTTGESLASPPVADATTPQKAATPGPVAGRAQRYSAALSLQVDDTDALSSATQQALAIARDLGGYVVSVHYATGDESAASVTLRVPSSTAADAVTRLSSLGTILGQNVQIDDLQATLDTLDRREQQLRARIAALTAAIDRADTAAERARLEEQRAQARATLRDVRTSHAATSAEARNATIQLDLRTEQDSGVAVPGSRLDRALDKALAVLAWEGVVLLAVAIAAAPLALVAAAVWATRRTRRRREEDRLLAAS